MNKIFLLALLSSTIASTFSYAQNTTDKLNRVRDLVYQSSVHGLQKGWYFSDSIESQIQQLLAAGKTQDLDQLLNSIADRLAKDLYRGRVTPDQVSTKAKIDTKIFPYSSSTNQFLNNQISAIQLLNTVQPKNSLYLKAQGLLNRLMSLKKANQWVARPANLNLTRAELNIKNASLVQYLRLKLNDFGYSNDLTKTVFDDDLKLVIQKFQTDHNLKADAIVGPISWSFLERSLDQLISQAILNIDRVRWLPDDISQSYVFVNLAQQRLQLIENNFVSMDFKTINGRLDRQTPMLVDKLKSVVLNPTWTVPYSIFVKDKLPILRGTSDDDKTFLARSHMEAIDDFTGQAVLQSDVDWTQAPEKLHYTIVQKPGAWNALGFVKFPLTNGFSIYLHDTNMRAFFDQDLRLLSSGCVRLSKPFEFTEKILNDPTWNLDAIKNFTELAPLPPLVPTNLNRKTSLPVYIFYQTLFAETDGRLISLNDHYEIDALEFSLMK